MPAYQDVKFQAVRQTDQQVVQAFESLREAGLLTWSTATFSLRIGETINGSPEDIATNSVLKEVLGQNSELVRTFTIKANSGLTVTLSRQDDQATDIVSVYLGGGREDQAPKNVTTLDLLKLEAELRTKLRALNYRESLSSVLGKELREYYEVREAELARLESAVKSAQEQVLQQALSVREHLETEFRERRVRQDEEIGALRAQLQEEAAERKSELDARAAELARKLKEIDDRDARHVRRGIRQDLKNEFARRGEKFELTTGTRSLRRPISNFVLVLLGIFGAGFIAYSVVSLSRLASSEGWTVAELVSLGVKQLFFGLAFGSTSLFFIRWQNQWFQRHAQEEFRLKRLELDFDRASWIVEMALEWRDEKGGELPPELLTRLTNRIFDDGEDQRIDLHPVDQLASAILGASAAATVKLPTGAELQLDRKSIRELDKLRKAE